MGDRILWVSLLFLALSSAPLAGVTSATKTCALYNPPSPGIHCYHSDQVLQALTGSKWAWVVEMYSSWCGHCQSFAPRFQNLAQEMEPWSGVVRVAVLECTGSKENQQMCSKMEVQAYPSIRFFKPHDPEPLQFKNLVVGGMSVLDLRHRIVDHVMSITPYPTSWPNFSLLVNGSLLSEAAAGWVPLVLVFEGERSYLGKELILDFSSVGSLRIRRVSNQNVALVRHYSILEFPSAVVEFSKGHYDIIPGHSVEDARSEFRKKITAYLGSKNVQFMPGQSHDRKPALSHQHHHDKLHPLRNRVGLGDLLSAVSYALRAEVPLHAIISGPAYSCLVSFVSLLEQAFSGVSPVGVSASLRAVRVKLEGRSPSSFITNREWHRIMDSKLDSALFPTRVSWEMCNGSLPHLRGFPCGLWMLMHTLTILTLPLNHTHSTQPRPFTSPQALTIMVNFVKNFFSCEVCRQHFAEMARAIPHLPSGSHGDAILWLWEAHNMVSARLGTEGDSGDPRYPKHPFPSMGRCPYCYLPHDQNVTSPNFNNTKFLSGESLLVGVAHGGVAHEAEPHQVSRSMLRVRPRGSPGESPAAMAGHALYVWNRTAVLLYLWNFYHLEHRGNETETGMERRQNASQPAAILQVAWPRPLSGANHYRRMEWRRGERSANSADLEVCLLPYMLCVLVMAVVLVGAWQRVWCRRVLVGAWQGVWCRRMLVGVWCRRMLSWA